MAVPEYYIEQDATIFATITNPDETAANPDGVIFRVKPPSGAVVVYTLGTDDNVVEETAGTVYSCKFDLNVVGFWYVRCEAIVLGEVVGAEETSLLVNSSNVL